MKRNVDNCPDGATSVVIGRWRFRPALLSRGISVAKPSGHGPHSPQQGVPGEGGIILEGDGLGQRWFDTSEHCQHDRMVSVGGNLLAALPDGVDFATKVGVGTSLDWRGLRQPMRRILTSLTRSKPRCGNGVADYCSTNPAFFVSVVNWGWIG